MVPRACVVLLFASAAEARSGGDVTALVQQGLRRGLSRDPEILAVAPSAVANNSSANDTLPIEHTPLYRINFTRTWGDDHYCITEVEFFDIAGTMLNASYVSMSSCYGCAIDCDGCTVPYGNPYPQFDQIWTSEAADAWVCSDIGEFDAKTGYGSTAVTFKVEPRRPVSYSIRRSNVEGDAIPKDWVMEELRPDGSWGIVSSVADAPKSTNQTYDVAPDIGPVGRWWEWIDPNCLTDYNGSGIVQRVTLDYTYSDSKTPLAQNNGHGIHFVESFGLLRLDGATYQAKQVHIVHPSKRFVDSAAGDNVVTAPLEMRIVHQKLDSQDYDDIAVVAVPLRLPLESESQDAASEQLFVNLGLTTLPAEGAPRTLPKNHTMNLTAFKTLLDAGADLVPCTARPGMDPSPQTQKWFITKPALVTGAVANAFRQMFPIIPAPPEPEEPPRPIPFDAIAGLGYNQLGRQTDYQGPAVDEDGPILVPAPPPALGNNTTAPGNQVARFLHNPWYQPGAGEWVSAGEWDIPPSTPAPTAQATPAPTAQAALAKRNWRLQ